MGPANVEARNPTRTAEYIYKYIYIFLNKRNRKDLASNFVTLQLVHAGGRCLKIDF